MYSAITVLAKAMLAVMCGGISLLLLLTLAALCADWATMLYHYVRKG